MTSDRWCEMKINHKESLYEHKGIGVPGLFCNILQSLLEQTDLRGQSRQSRSGTSLDRRMPGFENTVKSLNWIIEYLWSERPNITHVLLIVVNVDWGRKSRLLRVQDLLRQFEARREATEDGNINNFSKSNGGFSWVKILGGPLTMHPLGLTLFSNSL